MRQFYGDDIEATVLARLAGGDSLRQICATDGMPSKMTVIEWAAGSRPEFAEKYKIAREVGYLLLAEELLEIADDGSNDWIKSNDPANPGYRVNGEAIQRSRLRLDTRKWMLSKMLPKIYGERTTVDANVDGGLTIKIKSFDDL